MLQDALGPPEKLAELLRQLRARCLNLLEREEALDPERLIKYVERAYHNTVGAEAWLAHKRGVRNDAEREHGVSDFFTAVIDRLAPPAPAEEVEAGEEPNEGDSENDLSALASDVAREIIALAEETVFPDRAEIGTVRLPPRKAPARATGYPDANQPHRRTRANQTRDRDCA